MADKFDNHETLQEVKISTVQFYKIVAAIAKRCAREIFARFAWNIFATRTTQGAV